MYFLVSFKNENEMICSNIVIADSKEEAEAACSEYEWVRAEPATDAVLQWAANSGVPIISAKEKKIRNSVNVSTYNPQQNVEHGASSYVAQKRRPQKINKAPI